MRRDCTREGDLAPKLRSARYPTPLTQDVDGIGPCFPKAAHCRNLVIAYRSIPQARR